MPTYPRTITDRQFELLEVRTGTIKPLGDGEVLSAIDKLPRSGPVLLGPTGFEGDQQADTGNHGGLEKAALHYCADHYDEWALEFPGIRTQLRPGGFGENLVSRGLDESGVCIGDRLRIGDVLVQVSQPRGPCYKLGIRFGEPTMARRAEESGRTGWYYRVLEPGAVAAGDSIEIVDRPHPEWSVRRVQRLLYDKPADPDALATLAGLAALSPTLRARFARKLQSDDGEGD